MDRTAGADMPESPAVSLTSVSKKFSNGVMAIEGMNLDVPAGSLSCLLGPSGCGKTTVLRLIAGLIAPDGGAISLSGASPGHTPSGDVGFVFQDPALMPWKSVFGNVHLPLRLRGLSAGAARGAVMEMIEAVGLSEFAHAYPRTLSGGMRMRVSIARALVTRPKLLLMDEPFAALDEVSRHKLNDDLLRLWQMTGVTIVFVTHSVYETAFLANRIAVMTPRPGRVHWEMVIDRKASRAPGYRLSEDYRALCAEISGRLRAASGEVVV